MPIVEGETRLRLIAPDHGGIEDRTRHVAVCARRARAIGLAASLEQCEAALELARVAAHVGHRKARSNATGSKRRWTAFRRFSSSRVLHKL